MLTTTLLSYKVMNSPLDRFKQNCKNLLSYLESILAIHKHVEGQYSIWGKSTDFGVSSGMEHVTHLAYDLGLIA